MRKEIEKDGSWQKNCLECFEPLVLGEDWPEDYRRWKIYKHKVCNNRKSRETAKVSDAMRARAAERNGLGRGLGAGSKWAAKSKEWKKEQIAIQKEIDKDNGEGESTVLAEPKKHNKQADLPKKPEKDPGYEGISWGHDLDSELAKMKLSGTQAKRVRKNSIEQIIDFNTTKVNSPTFIIRDQQPGAIYAIRPYPTNQWYLKIGMLGADSPDGWLRSDYEKNLPPEIRVLMNYDFVGYLDLYVASAERHLRNVLKNYAQQDGNRLDFFIFSPLVPLLRINALLEQIIFRDLGADFNQRGSWE